MPQFKVRVPGFKFVVPHAGAGPVPNEVPVEALKPTFSEGFRETTETVYEDGKAKVLKRRQKVSRRILGRQVHREWLVVEAHSADEAPAKFAKAVGFAVDKGVIKQPEKGYEVLPYEPAGELVGAGVGASEAPAGARKKRSAEDALRQTLGKPPE